MVGFYRQGGCMRRSVLHRNVGVHSLRQTLSRLALLARRLLAAGPGSFCGDEGPLPLCVHVRVLLTHECGDVVGEFWRGYQLLQACKVDDLELSVERVAAELGDGVEREGTIELFSLGDWHKRHVRDCGGNLGGGQRRGMRSRLTSEG